MKVLVTTYQSLIGFNVDEMMKFIGLIFLSGYIIRFLERDYRNPDPDLRCDAFYKTMSRNRLFEIKSLFHAAYNHALEDSIIAKVKSL